VAFKSTVVAPSRSVHYSENAPRRKHEGIIRRRTLPSALLLRAAKRNDCSDGF
jgi:hypothetical protein